MLKGKSASPGIVLGKALVLNNEEPAIERKVISSPDQEISRFQAALSATKLELNQVRERALAELGPDKAAIFEAHLMMLEDPEMTDATTQKIRGEKICAEYAYKQVADQYVQTFEAMENEYMRERAADVRDVSARLIRSLLGRKVVDLAALDSDVVLVAHDLTPSETAVMNKKRVLGFLTNIGGKTSHTAIMARTLEIPAVLGLKNITETVRNGDFVAFNGETGEVIANPTDTQISKYKKLKAAFDEQKRLLQSMIGADSATPDGRKVKLVANIGAPKDLGVLKKNDAEGVGLYRTEFLFMDRDKSPTEDEQFEAYRAVVEAMGTRLTVIRTLDIGGDKKLPYINIGDEENPFLGNRAIRYCLQHRDFFRIQLRALLRASHYGRMGIMFPMISSLDEFTEAKVLLDEVKMDLKHEKIPFDDHVEVGVMIEIPSAAVLSDIFAKHVDFMSIGTNDLIQYTCAVDRMNESISDLYDPYHPAVLRLINQVIQNGHHEGIWVGVCGEMAGMPDFIPVLLGMGLHEFSMAPSSILRARSIIRATSYEKARKWVKELLTLDTSKKVKEFIQKNVGKS